MFEVELESENGVCKLKLYPKHPDFRIGGYGREDVLVFKGAPVSFTAIERMLKRDFGEVAVSRKGNSVEIEVQRLDCSLIVEHLAEAVKEMLENAARDLDMIESAVKETIDNFARKISGNGN